MNFKNIGFKSALEDDEQVVKVFRRRFAFFIIKYLFFCSFWGGILYLIYHFLGDYSFWPLVLVGTIAFYHLMFVFYHWFLNAIVMTTDNLIISEWEKFFHKNAFVINYWNLDEPIVKQNGIRAFIRNEGDIFFHKMSTGGQEYIFKDMFRPHKVIKEIHKYKERQLHEKNFTEESALKDLISQMVQTHARENGAPDENTPYKTKEEVRPQGRKKSLYYGDDSIEYEKKLDDLGGIEIDLSDMED